MTTPPPSDPIEDDARDEDSSPDVDGPVVRTERARDEFGRPLPAGTPTRLHLPGFDALTPFGQETVPDINFAFSAGPFGGCGAFSFSHGHLPDPTKP